MEHNLENSLELPFFVNYSLQLFHFSNWTLDLKLKLNDFHQHNLLLQPEILKSQAHTTALV